MCYFTMLANGAIKLLLLAKFTIYASSPIASAPCGQVRGGYYKSFGNRTFSYFIGIPYAQPPVGVLRFEPPKPMEPWSGAFYALKFHKICPQAGFDGKSFVVNGEEDCLYLNVYTPQLNFSSTNKLLPVIVFIHGGAFLSGNANANAFMPTIMMDQDVVLITINYRLGVLGFLATGDEVVPGNLGLKDQAFAIQWAKTNIKSFGGNPDKITVMGSSAGAASAHYHMLSPLSQNLISGVISLSGVATAHWALSIKNETVSRTAKLTQSFNCPMETTRQMIDCLKSVNFKDLVKHQYMFQLWNSDPIVAFKPVIEPNVPGAFLLEHPVDLIQTGKAAKIPFLTGITTEDGALRSHTVFDTPGLLQQFNHFYDKIAPITFMYDDTDGNTSSVSDSIKQFYFNDKELDYSSHFRSMLTNAYTDALFLSPLNKAAWLYKKVTSQPVYFYVFGYRGRASFCSKSGSNSYDYGVCHGDDLLYTFQLPIAAPSTADVRLQTIMTTMWKNFALSGNPTSEVDSFIKTIWTPIQSKNLEYYLIKSDSDISMQHKPYWNRTMFWKNLQLGKY